MGVKVTIVWVRNAWFSQYRTTTPSIKYEAGYCYRRYLDANSPVHGLAAVHVGVNIQSVCIYLGARLWDFFF